VFGGYTRLFDIIQQLAEPELLYFKHSQTGLRTMLVLLRTVPSAVSMLSMDFVSFSTSHMCRLIHSAILIAKYQDLLALTFGQEGQHADVRSSEDRGEASSVAKDAKHMSKNLRKVCKGLIMTPPPENWISRRAPRF
jgi:hypothetical protein